MVESRTASPNDMPMQLGRANSHAELFAAATRAWEAGEDEAFLPTLEQALPHSVDYRLWHIHGLILRRLDRRAEALESLKRAVALNPQAINPARALARTLYESGLPSIDAYGSVLRLAPNDPEVLSELTMAFVAAGEVRTAQSGLEKIVARSPLWVHGHVLLSQLRWMEGERDNFTRSFNDAIARHPDSLDLRREQLILLTHAEQWNEVLRIVAEGRQSIGELPLFALYEAIAHAEVGDAEVGVTLLEPFAGLDDGPIQIRRIRNLLRLGRVEEACAAIDPWLSRAEAFMFWPYASIAWRLAGDPRWEWLEGDERFVGVYDIADRLPPLDRLAATLRGLHHLTGEPLEQSLRGGSQSDGDLFMRIEPEIVQLREAIRRTVAEHAAQLPAFDADHPLLGAKRHPIRFSGSWSVRLHGAGFHANHVHPLGWISSALYIALPPDLGVGNAGYLTLGDPQSSCFEVPLKPLRVIEPRPGRLVLFPSYTWHGTLPFAEGERLTVAFDVARQV